MARKHTRLGYSHSDVLDYRRDQQFAGLVQTPRTQPIHISLNSAAASRRFAAQMQDEAFSFYKRVDHIHLARNALERARAWRMEIGL